MVSLAMDSLLLRLDLSVLVHVKIINVLTLAEREEICREYQSHKVLLFTFQVV